MGPWRGTGAVREIWSNRRGVDGHRGMRNGIGSIGGAYSYFYTFVVSLAVLTVLCIVNILFVVARELVNLTVSAITWNIDPTQLNQTGSSIQSLSK